MPVPLKLTLHLLYCLDLGLEATGAFAAGLGECSFDSVILSVTGKKNL